MLAAVYLLVFGGVNDRLCKSDFKNQPLKLLLEETLKLPYSKSPDSLMVVIPTFFGILVFVLEDKLGFEYKYAVFLQT